MNRDWLRLTAWLAIGVLLYGVSVSLPKATQDLAQLASIVQKWANVTGGGWLGYVLARVALGRIDHYDSSQVMALKLLARAVLMGATIWTIGGGL